MESQHTTAFLRKRKFLLVLPVLVMPFITLAFWAMGGGSAGPATLESPNALNKELPAVNIPARDFDKMSLYNQLNNNADQLPETGLIDNLKDIDHMNATTFANSYSYDAPDPNEAKVKAKLEALERMMNEPVVATAYPSNNDMQENPAAKELSNLEAMVSGMQGITSQEDPEIKQLNAMLETIMEIQNPELAKQKIKQLSIQQQSRVFAIGKPQKELQAGSMPSKELERSGFFTVDDGQNVPDTILNSTIPVVVHETQSLVTGATIKMRLMEAIYVNGQLIPEDTFISGICSVEGERLKIEITGLRNGNAIYPVSLIAYDLDAIEGIRIPGAITRDAAKNAAGTAVQNLQLMSLDPSIAAQTAGAGVEAVKGLFDRKTKLIRVIVKAGYPLLLVDLKGQQGR